MQQRVIDLVDFFGESKPAAMEPLELDLVDLMKRLRSRVTLFAGLSGWRASTPIG
jgi:hypothetical protein